MRQWWEERFLQYVTDPQAEWPDTRTHQARKFTDGLARFAADRLGGAERILTLAHRRAHTNPVTLFLINCGSSGSHWLTTMLGELTDVADCGEVYLPPSLLAEIRRRDPHDRRALLDCVHLAHVNKPETVMSATVLVNSAHSSGWRLADMYGDAAKRVLLVRDPLDIVLSRTFRKPIYRDLIAPGKDDRAYLADNVEFVRRFFQAAAEASPEVWVRYEDLRTAPVATLETVCAASGIPATRSDLQRAAELHGVDSPTTNAYLGPRIEPPIALVQTATDELEWERKTWGYL